MAAEVFGDEFVLVLIQSGAFDRPSSTQQETESNLKQRQIVFLNRIRKADPQHLTIERALFNARQFPGQDLTVFAYTPSNPPPSAQPIVPATT